MILLPTTLYLVSCSITHRILFKLLFSPLSYLRPLNQPSAIKMIPFYTIYYHPYLLVIYVYLFHYIIQRFLLVPFQYLSPLLPSPLFWTEPFLLISASSFLNPHSLQHIIVFQSIHPSPTPNTNSPRPNIWPRIYYLSTLSQILYRNI